MKENKHTRNAGTGIPSVLIMCILIISVHCTYYLCDSLSGAISGHFSIFYDRSLFFLFYLVVYL